MNLDFVESSYSVFRDIFQAQENAYKVAEIKDAVKVVVNYVNLILK